ncbi:MAG: D-cysteine desulfhydrase family protein [Armatimonadetes bacterium]|nr:D-cysteine desulfhydrase family protein [Armatimonadota bacterium]
MIIRLTTLGCEMRLDTIPRISLTQLPTPLIEAPRLAARLGLRRLLVKRDDCTTLGMGGNKVRKLEFLMADALEKGSDVVMTCGGPQSNHARLTAAACRKVGIERCILFLGGPDFERMNGNLLLDTLFGAEIRFMVDATVKEMDDAMNAEAEKLRADGRKPYVIPIGGSSPQGAMGYTSGIRELAGQLSDEDKSPLIFFAVGSCGTLTGVTIGCRLFLPEAEIIGISVSRKASEIRKIVERVAPEATELLGIDLPIDASQIHVEDCYYGERYGVASEAGNAAVLEMAQSEAIVLDPIYTGKAMSGLMDMARRKLIDTDRTVIFLHTGGGPGLFAFDHVFRGNAKLLRV